MKVLKKIILHIGLHKTATTSIQYALSNNHDILKSSGFLYPIFNNGHQDLDNHSIPLLSMFVENPEKYHMNLRFGFSDAQSCQDLNKKYYDQLFSAVNTSCCDKLILSAEGLTKLNKDDLCRFKEFLDSLADNISIIACVRSPVNYAKSVIQELVKGGAKLEDAENLALKSSSYIFKNSLSKFVSVFSGAEIDVYTFEESISCKYRSPEKFFFKRVGVFEKDIDNIEMCSKNESLSYESILIISFFNERFPLMLGQKKNKKHIAKYFSRFYGVKSSEYNLTESMVHDISQNSLNDIDWLENTFKIHTGYRNHQQAGKVPQAIWSDEILEQLKTISLSIDKDYRDCLADFLNSIILLDNNLSDVNKVKIRSASFFVSSLGFNFFEIFNILLINIKRLLKV